MALPTPIPCPFTSPIWSTRSEGVLVKATVDYVTAYMANYDASHDMSHIRRVVSLARYLHAVEPQSTPMRDPLVVLLAALMHDVGDRKYIRQGEDGQTLVRVWLVGQGAGEELAEKVQRICLGVSYSTEVKDPSKTAGLVREMPELAVVQDADRLDALGAVGIGRCFAFGGARERSLKNSIEHFVEKLEKLPGMMKTAAGRERAEKLGDRIRVLRLEFLEETETFLDNVGPDGMIVGGDRAVDGPAVKGQSEQQAQQQQPPSADPISAGTHTGNSLADYAQQLQRLQQEHQDEV